MFEARLLRLFWPIRSKPEALDFGKKVRITKTKNPCTNNGIINTSIVF
ncbi:hypothetical protein [Cohnella faecalis]|nr:hypothetical protein [Cohnella faecalis]